MLYMFFKNLIVKIFFLFIIFYFLIKQYFISINFIINSYLNNKNKNFLLYSKIFKISNKKNFNKKKIIEILLNHNYNISKKIISPGDLIIYKNNILFYKRSFKFNNKIYNSHIVNIKFKKNKLYKIVDVIKNKKVKNVKIKPIILNTINNNKNNNLSYCNIFCNIKRFPNSLIDILILIEDNNFYFHNGINFRSIFRAFLKNVLNFKIVQGGSTITQQLSRNIFLNNKKNIFRKIKEILISLCIENIIDKNKIIELYLNKININQVGNIKINGFYMASIYYYNKNIYELNLNELIVLINMLKGVNYNPIKNYVLSNKRKNIILKKLKENNIIDNKLYKNLLNSNVNFNINNNIKNNYSCYINKTINEYKNILNNNNINNIKNKNIKIFTNLDILKYNSIKKSINIFNKKNKNIYLDFLSLLINKKGDIINIFSSLNLNIINNINKIYNKKHIGSIIKPIINSILLDDPYNFRLDTYIPNNIINIKINNNKLWKPRNHNNFYNNKITLLDSLTYSLNIPYINIGLYIGLNKILNKINCFINRNDILKNKNYSVFLGSIDLSILEIGQIYQSLCNKGNLIRISSIKYILDKNNIIYKNKYNILKKTNSNKSSLLTLYNMKKVTEYGTSNKISSKFNNFNICSKTGTTNNYNNNWFIGVDKEDIFIIWIGNYNNKINNFNFKPINIYIEYLNSYNYILKNVF